MLIKPLSYNHLRGKLVGISDRMLNDHLRLYERYVEQYNAIRAAMPFGKSAPNNDATGNGLPVNIQSLLSTPVGKLQLEPIGPLAQCIRRVDADLTAKALPLPAWYLGEGDFLTPDLSVSVNIPWFLANPTLWRLASRQKETAYSVDQVTRALRHEAGHVIAYGFDLWKRPDFIEVFGDGRKEYPDDWQNTVDVRDPNFVSYLSFTPVHYGQKHPDEDWAETFAAWLDPSVNWQTDYAQLPVVMAKFQWIQDNVPKLAGQKPTNPYLGKRRPYQRIKATVGRELGSAEGVVPFKAQEGGWSEHAELLRREPTVRNAVALHELYFSGLGPRPTNPPLALQELAGASHGSWDAYLAELRTVAGNTHGWALTVYDPRVGGLRNVLVEGHDKGLLTDAKTLLAIDCWEHAYASDYGLRKDIYLGAVFENVNWELVARRIGAQAPTLIGLQEPDTDTTYELEDQQGDAELFDGDPSDPRFAEREGLVRVMRKIVNKNGKEFERAYWVKPKDLKQGDKVVKNEKAAGEKAAGPQLKVKKEDEEKSLLEAWRDIHGKHQPAWLEKQEIAKLMADPKLKEELLADVAHVHKLRDNELRVAIRKAFGRVDLADDRVEHELRLMKDKPQYKEDILNAAKRADERKRIEAEKYHDYGLRDAIYKVYGGVDEVRMQRELALVKGNPNLKKDLLNAAEAIDARRMKEDEKAEGDAQHQNYQRELQEIQARKELTEKDDTERPLATHPERYGGGWQISGKRDEVTANIQTDKPVLSTSHKANNVNATRRLRFADGTEAYYKPDSGLDLRVRHDIPKTQAEREVVGPKIAEMLGIGHLAPPVVIRDDLPEGRGSVAASHDFRPVPMDILLDVPDIPVDKAAFAKAQALDFILGNSDRHSGNWQRQELNGKVVPALYDHGLTLPMLNRTSWASPALGRTEEGVDVHPGCSRMINRDGKMTTWRDLTADDTISIMEQVRHISTKEFAQTLKDHGIEKEAVIGAVTRLVNAKDGLKASFRTTSTDFHRALLKATGDTGAKDPDTTEFSEIENNAHSTLTELYGPNWWEKEKEK